MAEAGSGVWKRKDLVGLEDLSRQEIAARTREMIGLTTYQGYSVGSQIRSTPGASHRCPSLT